MAELSGDNFSRGNVREGMSGAVFLWEDRMAFFRMGEFSWGLFFEGGGGMECLGKLGGVGVRCRIYVLWL